MTAGREQHLQAELEVITVSLSCLHSLFPCLLRTVSERSGLDRWRVGGGEIQSPLNEDEYRSALEWEEVKFNRP